ncbi:MAG: ATP-binding cassette domain-containing protein [Synergistaceae bacterium]|nr:ATP-binding cassette domain-containing protein [Synergistaceae bacterium]
MPSWFQEQIQARIKSDEDAFTGTFNDISEAVSGRRIFDELHEDEIANASDAIEEIARYYSVPTDTIDKAKRSENETLDERLESIFGTRGIMRRTVNLGKNWYKDACGVYLGVTKEGRYIALLPDYHGYSYKDYVTGRRIHINSAESEKLKTEGICFYRPMPARKLSVTDLMKFAAKSLSLSDVVYIALITLFVTLISMVTPFLTRIIYSQAVYSKDLSSLTAIFIFMISAGVSAILLQISRAMIVARIQTKANVPVNAAIMMRIINLPAEFFKLYSSGELSHRVSGIDSLCSTAANVIFSVGLTAAMSLIYLRQIFAFTPVLVMPALCIMAALLISTALITVKRAALMKKGMALSADEYNLLCAFINGMQKIKLAGAERRAFAQWASHYKNLAKLEYDPPLILKLSPVIQPVITLTGTFVLYLSAFRGGVTPEDYMAFMVSYGLLSGAFIALCGISASIASLTALIDMIKPVLEAVPEITQGKIITKFVPNIELQSVSFRYSDKAPLILDNLSFKIKAGEYVAIVGKSGCGKSTLMRLLLGFERPDSGIIYYNHNDLKTLNLKSLRSKIGCVMQNSGLFPGSIYSNITISAPQLSEKDAWKAAEMAGIADDIRKMPMKMQTFISEGASTISGGQRQRLIIARAIAPKPKILFFDEATSALDNITQKIVSDSLEKLKCTRIVIAHRLSTIKHCDRILVLDGGKITEEGTYDKLINEGGLFASLVQRQQLAES